MKPETGKEALLSFFRGILANLERVPAETLGFGAPVFTDLQAKQLLMPLEGKHFYCLNFALVAETKEARDEILFLVQMAVNQTLGGHGKEFKDEKKRITLHFTK